MHKHTLYITFDGLSDPLGQSQILPYLRGIAANGFHIHILSCEKKNRLEQEKQAILSLISGLPVSWNYIIYDEDAGMLSRFFYIRRLRAMAENLRKEKDIRLVHCRSYLASLIGLAFKTRYNIPFIFDMRGFWADERIDGGIWKKNNPLQLSLFKYFKKKEKQFIRQADAIISLTNAAVSELKKQYPVHFSENKVTVIPCCTDPALFNREAVTSTPSLTLAHDDHLLIYTGSIGTWYYTRELIDCILSWKEFIPNIRLLILTRDRDALDKVLELYTPEQKALIRVASATHKEIPAYLALAKAAIFFIKPSYSKIASSPTKMAECWAMDLPIITNAGIGDNDLYFNTHKGGILVNAFETRNYIDACQSYLALSQEAGSFRKIALDHFDTRTAITKYTAVYTSLTC